MTTCEFEEECETAIVGKCTHPEWRIEEDDCPHRKFAILVVNNSKGNLFVKHIENHLDDMGLETVICKICGKDVDTIYREALKMEED